MSTSKARAWESCKPVTPILHCENTGENIPLNGTVQSVPQTNWNGKSTYQKQRALFVCMKKKTRIFRQVEQDNFLYNHIKKHGTCMTAQMVQFCSDNSGETAKRGIPLKLFLFFPKNF